MQRLSSFDKKRSSRSCGPGYWGISFPANLSSPTDATSLTRGLEETDNLPPGRERILRLRLAFICQASFSESRKTYASPGPEGLEEREKKSIRGYGRCIDTCPRHRPLPAPEAAHIRHPARIGKLGASQRPVVCGRCDRTGISLSGLATSIDAAGYSITKRRASVL